ncbi:MAG TPA: choice-of-anchor D domain-containing protein [Candidatus Angelobacter sp.]|nr:choice-of-anchor D domain-containing protein [Candidatus Angelobacter sp.]
MRNSTKQAIEVGLFLALIILTLSAIGCGGGTQTAGGAPTPTPVPSPTPVSGSPSLSATPSSLAFGTQVLNTAMTQTVKITNTGSVAVSITQDKISGSGFTVGVTTPINLNVGQSLNVPVVFNPGAAGTVNGSLAIVSNGTTLLSVPLSGTGLAPLAHLVDVTWAASTSTPLQGYNVYRSTVSGGPYTKLSPTLSPTTLLFTDTTPLSGKQYFYVVTALNTSGAESSASSEVAVTIPVP